MLERLKDLKTRLQAVGDIHKNITMFTKDARAHTTLGERNATLVEDSIERSRDYLKVVTLRNCMVRLSISICPVSERY